MENNINQPVVPAPTAPTPAPIPESKGGFLKGFVSAIILIVLIAAGFYYLNPKAISPEVNGIVETSSQETSKAKLFLGQMMSDLGVKQEIANNPNGPGFVIRFNESRGVQGYLSSKLYGPVPGYTTQNGNGYENRYILCADLGDGVWCFDKIGSQAIDVMGKEVVKISAETKSLIVNKWGEEFEVKVIGIEDERGQSDGTFESLVDFFKKYPEASATFGGEWKGNAFETKTADWIKA